MSRPDGSLAAIGYSGSPAGKNKPSMQNVHNVGPIPQGIYHIGAMHNTQTHGPDVLPLAPDPENQMFGRDGFLIHGDSISHPGAASEGCIILADTARREIAASADRELQVTE